MPDLIPLLEANPDPHVVIDHMADLPLDRPDQLDLLLDLARYPRVFVKISHMWSLSKQPYPYPDAMPRLSGSTIPSERSASCGELTGRSPFKQLPYDQAVALFRDHLDFLAREGSRPDYLSKTVQLVWPFSL